MTHSDRIRETFSVFSRRRPPTATSVLEEIPTTFRDRLIQLYSEQLSQQIHAGEFSQQIIKRLQMLKGDLNFGTSSSYGQSSAGQILARHIHDCSPEELLDLIELSFRVTGPFLTDMPSIMNSNNEFVNAINVLFQIDHLPYRLTPMVYRSGDHNQSGWSVGNITEYPEAIIYEEELTHNEAVLPALHALADPRFASANSEFREALNDYRDGRCGDCIRNCCNSLESTIKAIHKANNWPVDQTATLDKLVDSLFDNAPIPQWFKQPMKLVGTTRNRTSTAHGGGNSPKNPEPGMTRFILTTTAACISWITEYKQRNDPHTEIRAPLRPGQQPGHREQET